MKALKVFSRLFSHMSYFHRLALASLSTEWKDVQVSDPCLIPGNSRLSESHHLPDSNRALPFPSLFGNKLKKTKCVCFPLRIMISWRSTTQMPQGETDLPETEVHMTTAPGTELCCEVRLLQAVGGRAK